MAYQLEKDINSWYAICIWFYELMLLIKTIIN